MKLFTLIFSLLIFSFSASAQTIKIDGVDNSEIFSASFTFDIQGGLTGYWIEYGDGKYLRASRELGNLVPQSYMKKGWVEVDFSGTEATRGHSFSVPRPSKTVKLGSTDFGYPEFRILGDGFSYWAVSAEGDKGKISVTWDKDQQYLYVLDRRNNLDTEVEKLHTSDLPEGWQFVKF